MRNAAVAGLALAVLLAPVHRAGAQDTRELERRVDLAVQRRDSTFRIVAAIRNRPFPPRVFHDTVSMLDGAVRILTDDEFLPLVRRAVAEAEPFIRLRAGSLVRELNGKVLSVWADSIRRSQKGLVVSTRVNSRELDDRGLIADASSVAMFLEDEVQVLLVTHSKPSFVAWLGSESLPVQAMDEGNWRAIRLELVTSAASVSRRCFAGDLLACKVTLGLAEERDPAAAWYDARTRRSMIERLERKTGLDRDTTSMCLRGADAACLALVRNARMLGDARRAPGSAFARAALVKHAFAMGGAGALVRAQASRDSANEVIAAIANAPFDSVVAQWQRHAHDGGIESDAATPMIALTAAAWMLAMCAVSMRSSRWR